MEQAIITQGKLTSPRTIILDEDLPDMGDSFEIIIIKKKQKQTKSKRKAGTLKGMIHMSDDFDDSIEELKIEASERDIELTGAMDNSDESLSEEEINYYMNLEEI
ncbi:conserved hypothetical protein [Desulfamplus magnetovallimortis]|uniref:DUF2281 domain-containing protein n=1 Tax=Desulfamplus magnetovallimortis TaxID=1246637 RepID=A0A1W1HBW1_9BACT|nr:DUF2281 domain-containing protein [Desulfamplus magnetovallimortis]SLM29868.1 conserved hypothetical protein [Desulfamplus magnetovallimortis]